MICSDEKEMRKRERLLNTYGFDVLDTDENGNLIYRQKAVRYLKTVYSWVGRERSPGGNE